MAYNDWSVTTGETPSASKWNQLGENDAGFKDGTNIDNKAITYNKWTNNICFKAYLGTNQSMGINTFTLINMGLEEYDLDNNFNTTNYRFVAPIDGIYYFSGQMYIISGNPASTIISIFKNGAENIRGNWFRGTHPFISVHVSGDVKLNANDYVDLRGYTETNAGTAISGASNTYFTGHLISQL